MNIRWTPKLARARSLRKLKALERRIEDAAVEIAHEWGDVDQYVCELCDQLRDGSQEELARLREAIIEAENRDRDEGK